MKGRHRRPLWRLALEAVAAATERWTIVAYQPDVPSWSEPHAVVRGYGRATNRARDLNAAAARLGYRTRYHLAPYTKADQ